MASETVPADRSEQEKLLDEGKKHLAGGHFPQAISAFKQLKQAAPLKAHAYFYLGVALAESGHLNAAAAELYEAMRLGPEQPDHALALGNVLARLGQTRQAMRVLVVFDQKTALNRLSSANLTELMKVYFSLERAGEAMRIVDELAVREPSNPRMDFYRGKIYKLMGNLDLAQHSIEKSLEKVPGNPADLFELGRIYEQRGQLAAAKKAYLEALGPQPDNPETLYALASVCLSLGEMDEAIQYLKRSEPAAASLPKIYYALGQAYQRKGERAKGNEYFKLRKSLESNLAERQKEMREREELTLVTLARESLKQGNISEARELFQQLAELSPDNWEAHQNLAEIFLSTEDWSQAYAHLTRLQEIDPSSFKGDQLMADYWYRRKDFSQALSFANRAVSIQPANADIRNLLGNIYLKLGQIEKAMEEHSNAVKYAPDRTDFRKDLETVKKVVETPP